MRNVSSTLFRSRFTNADKIDFSLHLAIDSLQVLGKHVVQAGLMVCAQTEPCE